MKTSYEIEVAQQDIDEGIRGDICNCMVQVALRRTIPDARRVEITSQTIRFSIEEGGKTYRLIYLSPRLPREYLIAFDAGDEIKPFSFELDKPIEIVERSKRPSKAAKTPGFHSEGNPVTVVNGQVVAGARAPVRRRSLRVYGERSFRVNQKSA